MTLVPGDPMATADYALSVTTEPRAVKAGQKTRFRIAIRHPLTGEPVTQFAEVHDKLFHFFIVSRDMTQFFHEHPVLEKDGSFTIEHVIPAAGHYMLFSDFMPVGGGPQMIASPLVTAGWDGDIASSSPNLKPETSFVKTANGVTVDLQIDPSKVIAGEEADVPIHFEDAKTGAPVKDLQRYLGAFGHAMMLSEDMTEHVHAHPGGDARRHGHHRRRRPGPHLPRAVPQAGELPHLAAVPAQQRVVDGAVYGASVAVGRDVPRRSLREGGAAAQ